MEMLHSRQSWTGYSCSAPFKYILSGPLYNKLLLAGQGLDISMAAVASELSRLEWFVDHLLMPDNALRIFHLSSHRTRAVNLIIHESAHWCFHTETICKKNESTCKWDPP